MNGEINSNENDDHSGKNDSDNLKGWSNFLVNRLLDNKEFEKAMILSTNTGELWGKTSEEFYFVNESEFKKLKSLFYSKGICYEECTCNTKGIEIIGKNYLFTKYFEDEDVIKYQTLLLYYSKNFCLIGIASKGSQDPVGLLSSVGKEIKGYLDKLA